MDPDLHGRNAEMWWKGDSETRYKYLYSAEEIEELADRVRTAAGQTKLLFAEIGNCLFLAFKMPFPFFCDQLRFTSLPIHCNMLRIIRNT